LDAKWMPPAQDGKARLFEPAVGRQTNGKRRRRSMDREGADDGGNTGKSGRDGTEFGNGNRGFGHRFGRARDRRLTMLPAHTHRTVPGKSTGETRQKRGKEQQ
jgi:hypothetical protein